MGGFRISLPNIHCHYSHGLGLGLGLDLGHGLGHGHGHGHGLDLGLGLGLGPGRDHHILNFMAVMDLNKVMSDLNVEERKQTNKQTNKN